MNQTHQLYNVVVATQQHENTSCCMDQNSQLYFTNFIGIIHFSSKYTYTEKNKIRKECTVFIKYFPQTLVKISDKKIHQTKDMYAVLKIESIGDKVIYCQVAQYLGEINDKSIENNIMSLACTCHWTVSKKLIPVIIDLTPVRKDYTNHDIYSIDPPGCLDIDDALHYRTIVENENTFHEIGIHIADVSSYIIENGDLDNELKARVETIYLSNKSQMNMIPSALSIHEISLLEGKTKRAFSIIIKLDTEYNIQNISFEKTNIKVKNLSYETAQNLISSNTILKNLYEVGKHLKEKIKSSFSDTDSYNVHQMVEVYMIYANKIVAEKIHSFDPNNVLLRGHTTKEKMIDNKTDSILLQKYNSNLSSQATYQIGPDCKPHQGLNLKYYTHFTSPIRRYADIIVHRQLWNAINSEQLQKPCEKTMFMMNFYGKFYKQMERYQKLMDVANKLNIDYDITNAFVTYIDDSKIKLYIPKYDLDSDYEMKENETITLFQEIQIKLVVSHKSAVKLKIELLGNT